MRVDGPGQHVQPAGVDLLPGRPRQRGPERRDPAVRDRDVERLGLPARRHDEPAADQQVGHPASRASAPASTATPRSSSSGAVYSSGWWLTPPALGTKIIPIGISAPSTIASW